MNTEPKQLVRRKISGTRPAIILLSGLGLTACGLGSGDEPEIARRLALEDTVAKTLLVTDGSFWLAGKGGASHVDSAGATSDRVRLPAAGGMAEILGESEGRIFVRTGNALSVISPGGSMIAGEAAEEPDAFILDPRGRFIYESAADGAITALDPATLLPVWGWGAVGGTSDGIALSPEGDRFYQAVNAEEDARLLVRDLQTGRILRETELEGEVRRMGTSRSGSIYILFTEGEDGEIARYDWEEGVPAERWRTGLEGISPTTATRLLPAPSGQLLAVLSPGNEEGLHIIDAETGESISQLTGPALDVAFGAGDELFLLVSGEILQLEPIAQ